MPKYNLTGSYRLVIIYRLGGAEDFGRGGWITWFLGEQKGGSVVTENPKGEITENFGRIKAEGETLKLGGGIVKVIKCY